MGDEELNQSARNLNSYSGGGWGKRILFMSSHFFTVYENMNLSQITFKNVKHS